MEIQSGPSPLDRSDHVVISDVRDMKPISAHQMLPPPTLDSHRNEGPRGWLNYDTHHSCTKAKHNEFIPLESIRFGMCRFHSEMPYLLVRHIACMVIVEKW